MLKSKQSQTGGSFIEQSVIILAAFGTMLGVIASEILILKGTPTKGFIKGFISAIIVLIIGLLI